MLFRWNFVLCAIVLLSILDGQLVNGRKGFGGGRHSYPKSGGLSGGGGHSYPKSGGLSGGGGHSYPHSGGLSGGGHSPSNHGYPNSGGMSGGSHPYPSSGGSHGYPSPGGSHGYPTGGGLSGNNHGSANRYPSSGTHTTQAHNYHYNPPQQIKYTPVSGGAPVSYPVYQGPPPTYVYNIKDSGSKYGTLLTGLALLNLGTTAYAITHSGGGGGSGGSGHYKAQPGEVCKFGLKKDNGDYEETRIDCQLITSFILQEDAKAQNNATNTSIITTTVTNITTVNVTNGVPEPAVTTEAPAPGGVVYMMWPNGTLVPLNGTTVNGTTVNATSTETSPNNTMTSTATVTTTITNTTVTNALEVKGKPIDVTPGMQCFVMRTTTTSRMKKSVPCGLLQTYAEKSLKKNSAARNAPVFTILAAVIAFGLSY